MNLHRLGATFLAAIAVVSLGACGGGEETITPTGPHYHYVANRILAPTSSGVVNQYGLDLNGDGSVDNQLGVALSLVGGIFDIQAALDKAVLSGKLMALVDVQAPDFNTASGAGVEFFFGDNPQPAPCSGPSDTVTCTTAKPAMCMGCGKHFNNGSFSISANSPQDGALTGKIAGGTFTAGPGKLTLMISVVGSAPPIRFDLVGARIKGSGITESSIGTSSGSTTTGGFILAGAVKKDDVDKTVVPGVIGQINAAIKEDCSDLSAPPGCGCNNPSTGRSILESKEINSVKDCEITEAELGTLLGFALRQDVVIDGQSATSAGVKVTATKATFTVPGQ